MNKAKSDKVVDNNEQLFDELKRLHSTNDYWSPVDYEEMKKVA